jgi:hypothetical protein
MVDEKVGEAVGAQPIREHVGVGVVLAGMTDEKNRHSRNYCWRKANRRL